LSEEHWDVINFLRDYFEEYQIAPAVRVLTKAIGKQFGKEKGHAMIYKTLNYDNRYYLDLQR
jgi:tRNA 2-thiouridine synthesizing protein E